MTENQKLALSILGYLPKGYILVTEKMNTPTKGRVGGIYANGVPIASFKFH